MRMTSASNPSSRKKPRLTANPDGKKLMLKLVTEIRILSAAIAQRGGAPTSATRDNTTRTKFFIREGSLSLLVFLSSFEDRLRDGAIGAAAADIAAQPLGNLFAGGMRIFNQQRLRRHDLPRRAVTALRADITNKGFLERI